MWGDKTEKNEIGEESYVACMGAYWGIDGRVILRWILWK